MFKKIAKKIIIFILIWETRLILKIHRPKIIAITGSVGKTSTKDAIYFALKDFLPVRRSEKSYNSELGVPLTVVNQKSGWSSVFLWVKVLLGGLKVIFQKDYPKWLILEVGADHPGDIRKIVKWLKPDLAMVTRLPEVPAHIEFFKNKDEVVAEKMSLVEGIKDDGWAILNLDDQILKTKKNNLDSKHILTYGFSAAADVYASDVVVEYQAGAPWALSFNINTAGVKKPVLLKGVLGQHQIYSFLGAVAVAKILELNISQVVDKLVENYRLPKGRFNLLAGIKGSLILDDTYNSSPEASAKAMETIKDLKLQGRKIAVLGDMLELGVYSAEAHFKIGQQAGQTFDILITTGKKAKGINKGAINAGLAEDFCLHFEDKSLIGAWLKDNIKSGDLIFVKGSQGMRLEKVVAKIMLQPELKKGLLCRQDDGWENL